MWNLCHHSLHRSSHKTASNQMDQHMPWLEQYHLQTHHHQRLDNTSVHLVLCRLSFRHNRHQYRYRSLEHPNTLINPYHYSHSHCQHIHTQWCCLRAQHTPLSQKRSHHLDHHHLNLDTNPFPKQQSRYCRHHRHHHRNRCRVHHTLPTDLDWRRLSRHYNRCCL